MLAYIIRRLFWLIPVLLAVSIITFTMMHMVPGGPWDANVGAKALSPTVRAAIAKKYGLDKPLTQQYVDYISGVLHFDLGLSYFGTRTVNQIIADGFPVTAKLGLIALLIAVVVGVPLGLIAALRHNTWIDNLAILIVTIGYSVPNFVIGIAAIIILAVALKIPLPIRFDQNNWLSWIMPASILSIISVSAIVRLTRSATLEVLGQDYVRTARAKGLSAFDVNASHVLRNALIPVVTLLGPLTANLVTGSFIIEKMFSVTGIGRYFVESVLKRDWALFMGLTLFYAILIIMFNLAVDLTYSFLDPRISRS
jgi:oligopeptide transport system permease protein